MRTTLDLPDELYKRLKLRAVHEGKTLKEVVLWCLEEGLRRQVATPAGRPLPIVPEAGRAIRAYSHAELWEQLERHEAS